MARASEHHTQAPAPGTLIDGYCIDRVIAVRTGSHALVAATAPGGERVTLKLPAGGPRSGRLGRRRRPKRCLEDAPPNAITLAELLREGPIDPEWAVALLTQVATALEAGRGAPAVHRALSPSAIVVAPSGPPWALLADLGGDAPAKPACELPSTVEDADYRSPEEIHGEPATAASNVYSLACILVECLTGAPPYPYNRPLLALHAHLTAPPPMPSRRNPSLPPELDTVVADAMSKDPQHRDRTPMVFMRAARLALGLEEPPPAPEPPKHHFKPHRSETPSRRERRINRKEQQVPRERRTRVAARSKERPGAPKPAAPKPAAPKAAKQPAAPKPAAPKAERPAAPPRLTRKQRRRARRQASSARAAAPAPKARRQAPPAPPPASRQERRGRPREERPARPRSRRLAPVWIGIALLASALAGFSAGNTGSSGGSGGTAQSSSAATVAEAPAKAAPAVSPVVDRLDRRRAAARRRLQAAHRPTTQAAAAADLAAVYRDAARAVRRDAAGDASALALARHLRAVDLAYVDLAGAARRHDARAWQRARAQVVQRERDLELLLRTHTWT
jgi:Protein kinase domain